MIRWEDPQERVREKLRIATALLGNAMVLVRNTPEGQSPPQETWISAAWQTAENLLRQAETEP